MVLRVRIQEAVLPQDPQLTMATMQVNLAAFRQVDPDAPIPTIT